jgi:uncharacterized Tic20 family protein
MSDNVPPPIEERLLAALSHGAIAGSGAGILIGLLVYVTQREKARYAAFQGLQAAIYQIIALVLIIIVWVLWTILYSLSFIPLMGMPEDSALPAIFWISMASMAIPFVFMFLIGLYGLIAAWQTWKGRPFRYVLFGNWLAKELDKNDTDAAVEVQHG